MEKEAKLVDNVGVRRWIHGNIAISTAYVLKVSTIQV